MRAFILPTTCAVFAIAALSAESTSAAEESLVTRIEKVARPYIDNELVVGVSIGVLDGGKRTTVHLGRTDIGDDGQQPDDETVYEIGSASKVFTGILVADAVIRGAVRLDQPAQELLPDNVSMPTWKNRPITILDLATHRAGFPQIADNMLNVQTDNPYAGYTSRLAIEFLAKHKLRHEPGTRHGYSNFGMSLVGYLISNNAGQSYDNLLRQRIAQPLGMNSTSVVLSPSMQEKLATAYDASRKQTSTWEFGDMPGAGGIRSSTRDMLRFMASQLNPPKNETGRAIQLAWKKHVDGGGPAMGLGWYIGRDGKTRWHNGQTGGYHSQLGINREEQRAVIVLANTATMEVDALFVDVVGTVRGAKVKPRSFEKPIRVSKQVMQRYVGRYRLTPAFVFTVSVQDEKLMVGITNQPTNRVFPRSETEWYYRAVKATLKFQLNENGECESLQLIQNGVTQTAKRIK